jgi:hypothetical protein
MRFVNAGSSGAEVLSAKSPFAPSLSNARPRLHAAPPVAFSFHWLRIEIAALALSALGLGVGPEARRLAGWRHTQLTTQRFVALLVRSDYFDSPAASRAW